MLKKFLKQLPHFKGKFRLARFFWAAYLNKAIDIEISGKHSITYKVPNAKESIGFELFVNGIYESDFINLIIKNIPPNGTLLDLGANIGSICIPISKLRPDIKIYAIEASPRVFSYLKYNVEKNNCKNIIIENKALSTEDNQTVSFYSPPDLFGKGSLNPVFTNVAETVRTLTLDSFIKQQGLSDIDFIKIDVEGFEKPVLSSGINLLAGACAPKILFEFSDWMENQVENCKSGDCQKFLSSLGYTLYDVSKPNTPTPLQRHHSTGSYTMVR
jgi:FkbM family methyltransferase